MRPQKDKIYSRLFLIDFLNILKFLYEGCLLFESDTESVLMCSFVYICCISFVCLDSSRNKHRFEIKLDCPKDEDCKELVKRHLDPLRNHGVEVSVEAIDPSHQDL